MAFCPDFIELLGCGASYHHRCHEQDFGKAHDFFSERVAFHGTYLALVRVPIASMPPPLAPDAPSPVSFARNTVLGPLLSMAGRFGAVAMIAVSEGSLSLG